MSENNVTYYESANWAYVNGNYTPNELREIADKIEEDHQNFKDRQKGAEPRKED